MANTYTWVINKLDVRPIKDSLLNVVYNINWTYTATSDQTDADGNFHKVDLIGTSLVGEPDASNFTDFDSLTQAQVEEWLSADESIANIQTNADTQVERLITPTSVAKNVPW